MTIADPVPFGQPRTTQKPQQILRLRCALLRMTAFEAVTSMRAGPIENAAPRFRNENK
jgi:hypothetical protein